MMKFTRILFAALLLAVFSLNANATLTAAQMATAGCAVAEILAALDEQIKRG